MVKLFRGLVHNFGRKIKGLKGRHRYSSLIAVKNGSIKDLAERRSMVSTHGSGSRP